MKKKTGKFYHCCILNMGDAQFHKFPVSPTYAKKLCKSLGLNLAYDYTKGLVKEYLKQHDILQGNN